jgi:hypothetical protein
MMGADWLAIHEALIEACAMDLAIACGARRPDGVALVFLPHGTPETQVAFGSQSEVARELFLIASDEGAAVVGVHQAASDLLGAAPAGEGKLLCVVVALGRVSTRAIEWPKITAPVREA